MKEGDIVFIKTDGGNRIKDKIGTFYDLGGIGIPLIRVEDKLYSVYKEEMVKIPDEIKNWSEEEIKLFLAL